VFPIEHEVELSLDEKLNTFFSSLHNLPVPDINVGTTIQAILTISATHGIKFEGNLALLLTQLVTLEGIARGLDPDINIIGSTLPFLLNR
jgi:predicted unusual protein kinase regulating ubiquinone biosynthesis (AarF/ABC1/UbiB family)